MLNGTPTTDEINVGLLPHYILLRPPEQQLPFNCSGTLLRNDVVLTAGHCFQADEPGQEYCYQSGLGCPTPDFPPSEMRVTQHAAADIHVDGAVTSYQQSGAVDAAVFRLASPFTVNGSTLGHSVPLWGGTEADLDAHVAQGQQYQQRGYGFNGGVDCQEMD